MSEVEERQGAVRGAQINREAEDHCRKRADKGREGEAREDEGATGRVAQSDGRGAGTHGERPEGEGGY